MILTPVETIWQVYPGWWVRNRKLIQTIRIAWFIKLQIVKGKGRRMRVEIGCSKAKTWAEFISKENKKNGKMPRDDDFW